MVQNTSFINLFYSNSTMLFSLSNDIQLCLPLPVDSTSSTPLLTTLCKITKIDINNIIEKRKIRSVQRYNNCPVLN